MLGAIKSRLRSDAPLAYGIIQALTGIADGLWQGAYAWFLNAKLGFTAPEIAIVIGSQFILQIILEVPSGTWADKGNTRRVLVYSYVAFCIYCLIYAGAGHFLGGEVSEHKSLLLGLAVLAEAFFGVGSAFLSGTLDAWVAERERAASREQATDFANRLRKVHSISELWGQAPSAIVGTVAFIFAARGHPDLPWILGALTYLAAGTTVLLAITVAPRPEEASTRASMAENIGRFTSRAVSYLQEQPETLRLFVRGALAYMPFYATQVFWIPFLAQTLFINQGDVLGTGGLGLTIPLLATMWGAGELARALGGSLLGTRESNREAQDERPRRLRHVSFGMFGYGVGIAMQLAAVLVDWYEVQIFAGGYLLARFCEGRVRRDLAVVMDESIVSDRATLRSLDSLIKSLVGLIYIALVGALMFADPTIGYLTILVTALLAGVQFVMLAREPPVAEVPPEFQSSWHHGNWLTFSLVVVLLAVLVAVGSRSRPLWTQLNVWSRKGDIVHMTQIETRTTRSSTADQSALVTWDMSSEGAHDIGCRVPIESTRDLWNNDLTIIDSASEGEVRATMRTIDGAYYVEFKLLPRHPRQQTPNVLTVKLSENSSRFIQCFRLLPRAGDAIWFDERGVVPVEVSRMNPASSSSLIIYVELVVGVSVVFILLGLAGQDVRRRLQEVLQTVPGTLLDQARQARPELIRSFEAGLPVAGFDPFEKFLGNLGASCLILGGYTSDGRVIAEIAIHKYGIFWNEQKPSDGKPPIVERVGDLRAVLPSWLSLVTANQNKQDAMTRKLGGRENACYAAASVVLRAQARGDARRGRVGGFAVALFARDEAPRYISPVERKILQLLAELSRMQLERAHRNVDVHDTLHWAKTILDTIRVPLSDAVRIDQYDLQLIAGCAARAALGHSRLSEKLGVTADVNPPVPLLENVRSIARLFTVSAYGAMTVELQIPTQERLIRHHAWVLIEGALIELLWNAAKYGSTREHRNVAATLRISDGDPYRFVVENDRPLDPAAIPRAEGVGLVTTPRRVDECGGEFNRLSSVDGKTTVGFSLPQAYVEELYETGTHSRS